MHPAKEVGGDFYDFFLIDQDHCGVVIADVSGKGVPAALFMMRVKALLNQLLREDLSPDRCLLERTTACARTTKPACSLRCGLGCWI